IAAAQWNVVGRSYRWLGRLAEAGAAFDNSIARLDALPPTRDPEEAAFRRTIEVSSRLNLASVLQVRGGQADADDQSALFAAALDHLARVEAIQSAELPPCHADLIETRLSEVRVLFSMQSRHAGDERLLGIVDTIMACGSIEGDRARAAAAFDATIELLDYRHMVTQATGLLDTWGMTASATPSDGGLRFAVKDIDRAAVRGAFDEAVGGLESRSETFRSGMSNAGAGSWRAQLISVVKALIDRMQAAEVPVSAGLPLRLATFVESVLSDRDGDTLALRARLSLLLRAFAAAPERSAEEREALSSRAIALDRSIRDSTVESIRPALERMLGAARNSAQLHELAGRTDRAIAELRAAISCGEIAYAADDARHSVVIQLRLMLAERLAEIGQSDAAARELHLAADWLQAMDWWSAGQLADQCRALEARLGIDPR
ncbi:MAG: hypothetical protein KDA25_03245, partial [Phycisphaerales bacterium]|nr:hypothetical protein [Phycisphaerales bacterium]